MRSCTSESATASGRSFATSLCRYYLPILAGCLVFAFFAFSPLVSSSKPVQVDVVTGALEPPAARTTVDGPVSGSNPEMDRWFVKAMNLYHAGRYGAAYGNLWQLADEGHADAARMALMMLRLGPTLYAAQWAASADQIEHWSALASKSQPKIVADLGGD